MWSAGVRVFCARSRPKRKNVKEEERLQIRRVLSPASRHIDDCLPFEPEKRLAYLSTQKKEESEERKSQGGKNSGSGAEGPPTTPKVDHAANRKADIQAAKLGGEEVKQKKKRVTAA